MRAAVSRSSLPHPGRMGAGVLWIALSLWAGASLGAQDRLGPGSRKAFPHSGHVPLPWFDTETYAEAARDCLACHVAPQEGPPDVREGVCLRCHYGAFRAEGARPRRKEDKASFRHRDHARLECRSCHFPPKGASGRGGLLEVPADFPVPAGSGYCRDCHDPKRGVPETARELLQAFLARLNAADNEAMGPGPARFRHRDHLDSKKLKDPAAWPECLPCHESTLGSLGLSPEGGFDLGFRTAASDACASCHAGGAGRPGSPAPARPVVTAGVEGRSLTAGTFAHRDHDPRPGRTLKDPALEGARRRIEKEGCFACHRYDEPAGTYLLREEFAPSAYPGCIGCHAAWRVEERADEPRGPAHSELAADTGRCEACHVLGYVADMKGARPEVEVRRVEAPAFPIRVHRHPFITARPASGRAQEPGQESGAPEASEEKRGTEEEGGAEEKDGTRRASESRGRDGGQGAAGEPPGRGAGGTPDGRRAPPPGAGGAPRGAGSPLRGAGEAPPRGGAPPHRPEAPPRGAGAPPRSPGAPTRGAAPPLRGAGAGGGNAEGSESEVARTCRRCHIARDALVSRIGTKRFSHASHLPRAAAGGATPAEERKRINEYCVECHGGVPASRSAEELASRAFGLDGVVFSDVSCARCHRGSGLEATLRLEAPEPSPRRVPRFAHSDHLGRPPRPGAPRLDCLDCHEPKAGEAGIGVRPEAKTCTGAACHDHGTRPAITGNVTRGYVENCLHCHRLGIPRAGSELAYAKATVTAFEGRQFHPHPDSTPCEACHRVDTGGFRGTEDLVFARGYFKSSGREFHAAYARPASGCMCCHWGQQDLERYGGRRVRADLESLRRLLGPRAGAAFPAYPGRDCGDPR